MSDASRLRILVVGASGMLGRAVVAELGARHEIISAGSKSGHIRLDIADPDSIVAGLKAAAPLDAVACAAGAVNFPPLSAIAPAPVAQSAYGLGLINKLMGQVNLTLAAREVLRDGGSITLIAGVLADAADRRRLVGEHGQRRAGEFRPRGGDRIAARPSRQCGEPNGVRGIDGRLWAVLPRLRPRPRTARRARLQPQHRGPADRPSLQGAVSRRIRWSFCLR